MKNEPLIGLALRTSVRLPERRSEVYPAKNERLIGLALRNF